jgi:glycosyltransferase involved in cell wall biosynthesis
MNIMKIALLSEKYTPDIGGLAISAERLGHLLTSAGHEVRVFAPTSNLSPSAKQTLLSNGISVTRFGARKRVDDTLVDWFDLIVKEHQREPFDVLHAYFLPQAGFVAAYAGKYLGVPSVVSARGNDLDRAVFDPAKAAHVMYALQNASAVATNASDLIRKAKALVNRDVTLIPNGIDTEHFKPMERNEGLAETLGINQGKMKEERSAVIGFAGELREKKGLAALVGGYAQLNRRRPTALLIVGDVRAGEDKSAFEELKAAIPNAKIILTGTIPHKDMPAYYALMDIFVHPSLRDGLPNALLEAMACEKAVIATPVGGTLDLLEDGKNGMFVNVNDASALAGTINDLLENSEKRRQLGKSAREAIVSKFTLEKELEANLAVYRKLGASPDFHTFPITR